MRQFFIFICLSLYLIPTILAASLLTLDKSTYDIGDIFVNHNQIVSIPVRNEGNTELTINRISSSCGCISNFQTPLVIQSGTTVAITFTVEAGIALGKKKYSITLHSDNSENNQTELIIEANIVSRWNLQPGYLFFPELTIKKSAEGAVTLGSNQNKQFQVMDIAVSASSILVTQKPSGEKNNSITFHVTLPGYDSAGLLDERIIVTTDDPEERELIIPIRGIIHGDTQIKPNRLYLRIQSPEETVERSISIVSKTPEGLQISSIESDLPNVSVEMFTVENNREYTVKVKITPPYKTSRFKGQLTIKTTSKTQSTYTIPISGNVKVTSDNSDER